MNPRLMLSGLSFVLGEKQLGQWTRKGFTLRHSNPCLAFLLAQEGQASPCEQNTHAENDHAADMLH